jgi:putative SOS response-associated peptidase YedK
MCGRYTFTVWPKRLATHFLVPEAELPFGPRYNVAPTQELPIIRQPVDGGRVLAFARWGLIPSWAKDAKIGNRLINARGETVATMPSFRSAFKARRCLVPADGFYEWHKLASGGKQPFYLHFGDRRPFAFAGLWEHWQSPDGELVDSYTILTTGANAVMKPIHDRMPVILDPADYDRWLDPTRHQADALAPLLRPYEGDGLIATPVGTFVNNPRHEGAECLAAADTTYLDEPASPIVNRSPP